MKIFQKKKKGGGYLRISKFSQRKSFFFKPVPLMIRILISPVFSKPDCWSEVSSTWLVSADQSQYQKLVIQQTRCQGWNFCFSGSDPRIHSFFRLPKRVNRDIFCIATKVRKLQIYPIQFQHKRLEYISPLPANPKARSKLCSVLHTSTWIWK